MLPTPYLLTSDKRQIRSLTQDVIPFLNNIIFQYTNPISFETKAHTIDTIPLARELCDSYLYNFRYKTLEITQSQTPFTEDHPSLKFLLLLVLNLNHHFFILLWYRYPTQELLNLLQ